MILGVVGGNLRLEHHALLAGIGVDRKVQHVGGEPAEMAGQFFGLLWGNLMLGLLLATAERPGPREIARRAEAASDAFLRAYPALAG